MGNATIGDWEPYKLDVPRQTCVGLRRKAKLKFLVRLQQADHHLDTSGAPVLNFNVKPLPASRSSHDREGAGAGVVDPIDV